MINISPPTYRNKSDYFCRLDERSCKRRHSYHCVFDWPHFSIYYYSSIIRANVFVCYSAHGEKQFIGIKLSLVNIFVFTMQSIKLASYSKIIPWFF